MDILIEIVGFNDCDSARMRKHIIELLEEIKMAEKTETSIIRAVTQTCIFDHPAPYIKLYGRNQNTTHEVANQLSDGLNQTIIAVTATSILPRKEKNKR